MCSKPYLNVFTCFCINWPTLIVMQTALNKCNRPTFIPLLWKNIRCCPRVISRSRLLHVCMWYKTKLFSTGFFRWRGWTKIQHICVTAATNCSSTLKTNNGLFSVMIIPFLAKALLYRMCLCVLTLKEAKKKKKKVGAGGQTLPISLLWPPQVSIWSKILWIYSHPMTSKFQEVQYTTFQKRNPRNCKRWLHNTVNENHNKIANRGNKALGSRSPGGPRERGAQWVNNFRRVNQLTSRDGSGDEDLAAEEPAFFLVPSSGNGIVALLWRSEVM